MHTERFCEWCGKLLTRKRKPSGKLEDLSTFRSKRFCNSRCYGDARMAANQNPSVAAGRKRAQRRFKRSACLDCGETEKRIDRHHLDGNPANNSETNVIPLCASCHAKRHWQEGSQAERVARQRITQRDPTTGRIVNSLV
jgi:hypothetical protein